jgi:hypothetical protein
VHFGHELDKGIAHLLAFNHVDGFEENTIFNRFGFEVITLG